MEAFILEYEVKADSDYGKCWEYSTEYFEKYEDAIKFIGDGIVFLSNGKINQDSKNEFFRVLNLYKASSISYIEDSQNYIHNVRIPLLQKHINNQNKLKEQRLKQHKIEKEQIEKEIYKHLHEKYSKENVC